MPRPETVKTHWRDKELKLYVRPWRQSDDSVIREVLERRAYERHGVALGARRRWLDCGAHIGTFALAAASAGSSAPVEGQLDAAQGRQEFRSRHHF